MTSNNPPDFKIEFEGILLRLTEDLFHTISFKSGLLIANLPNGTNDQLPSRYVKAVSEAVVCKQQIYRVLFKTHFLKQFPKFFQTDSLFRNFVDNMLSELFTYGEHDFYEKLFTSTAFMMEAILFCHSRTLPLDLKVTASVWTKVFVKYCVKDTVTVSFDGIIQIANERYTKLHSILEPYISSENSYKTNLFIDQLYKMFKSTQEHEETEFEVYKANPPNEILTLFKEYSFVLQRLEDVITTKRTQNERNSKENTSVKADCKSLDFVLFQTTNHEMLYSALDFATLASGRTCAAFNRNARKSFPAVQKEAQTLRRRQLSEKPVTFGTSHASSSSLTIPKSASKSSDSSKRGGVSKTPSNSNVKANVLGGKTKPLSYLAANDLKPDKRDKKGVPCSRPTQIHAATVKSSTECIKQDKKNLQYGRQKSTISEQTRSQRDYNKIQNSRSTDEKKFQPPNVTTLPTRKNAQKDEIKSKPKLGSKLEEKSLGIKNALVKEKGSEKKVDLKFKNNK